MPEIEEVLPKYLQISGYIRDQIMSGELAPGAEVPSERELAAAWKVARPTASKALNTLRQQGLVISQRGSGTYVADSRIAPQARERYERARRYGTMYTEQESVTILSAELLDGPDHVTSALRIAKGSTVIARCRLVTNESGLSELATSWFPGALAETAAGLLSRERLSGGTAQYVESMTGRKVAYARDQVSARLATDAECEHLGLPKPAAVLAYRLTVHALDGAVLQFDEAVYPQEWWAFQQEYSIGS
ncbi:GntR family transcriptional regulator [Nocardia sp. XZ_19_385]|uniref:GntR family transcriptional regulator n=1 Tax=Nocardia sp. XZ_19_385 TaxID=2769488 RepID=UPI00188EFF50|nr:GntR family transcriptional regulator [Nocardia sp. XZ_19_385]